MIPLFIQYMFVAVLGLCLGSFATALAYRLPRRLPFAWTCGQGGRFEAVRSMCPPCGRTLTARELVPVLSWVFQRGRCGCGRTRIPVFYPAVEVGVMGAALGIFAVFGPGLVSVVLWMVLPFFIGVIIWGFYS